MLLDGLAANPPIGSLMESELLSQMQLLEITKNPNALGANNREAILRTAAGMHDLAAKILSTELLPDFPGFKNHIKLINSDKVKKATINQMGASLYGDDTSRKIAELYIGCLAAHIGTNIVLDDPNHSTGDNPDVMFDYDPGHVDYSIKKWALAIKTISSTSGQTISERISEASNQINSERCTADAGMIIINLKDAIRHNDLYKQSFPDLHSAGAALLKQIQDISQAANKDRPQREWDAIFTGKVVRPVIFLRRV